MFTYVKLIFWPFERKHPVNTNLTFFKIIIITFVEISELQKQH